MSQREAFYRAICQHPHEDTPRLVFADHLEESGEPERAEFCRVQCELESWGCTFRQTFTQPGWKHNCGTDENGYWLCQPRRSRERELFAAHRLEWFERNVFLDRLSNISLGPYLTVARGFPSHWYGTWEAWVGGACERCQGLGRFDITGKRCTKCKGSGRIPGACHRAWKPSWKMECGMCQGRKVISVYERGEYGPNRFQEDCGLCLGDGRVPMPMPSDALPIVDVTPTTYPTFDPPIVGEGYPPQEVVDQLVKERLAILYPDVTFHLPG